MGRVRTRQTGTEAVNVPLWVTLLLALGSTARITRLIVADTITAPLRTKVMTKYGADSKLATLTSCTWCMSTWVSLPVALLAYAIGDTGWFVIPALALTLSYATSLIAQNLD